MLAALALVGQMTITCTQKIEKLDQPNYTATVYASKDGKGTLVLSDNGVVVLSEAITTGGNGDTHASIQGKDVYMYVDAEDGYAGKLEVTLKGKKQTIDFSRENPTDMACSPTPNDWRWTPRKP